VQRRLRSLLARRGVVVGLQLGFVVAFTAILGYFLRDVWAEALPLLREADLLYVGISLVVLAAYYLLFVLGWQVILAGLGVRIGYPLALQAEMASMLAKYVPGTVWTPLARIVWLRRAGVRATAVVLGSIALEAGLSALSGVLVFAVGVLVVGGQGPEVVVPLAAFGLVVGVLIHPRVFGPLARRIFRRFGGDAMPVLSYRLMLSLLAFYSATWLVGGVAVYFLVRSLGGDPGVSSIPFLGGTAAVGAIVAVLSIVAPSGLGVREGSMYGLLLAVTSPPIALGVTVLNRLAITIVEALLLALGLLAWSAGRRTPDSPLPEPELARREA
jgi:glycosyltransferase 2 family protein